MKHSSRQLQELLMQVFEKKKDKKRLARTKNNYMYIFAVRSLVKTKSYQVLFGSDKERSVIKFSL
jgi:hypothetical protein